MTVAFYVNSISPHQLPLASCVCARVGLECFRYVYRDEPTSERASLGWSFDDKPMWCMKGNASDASLGEVDLLYTGIRCLPLMESRAQKGKKTYYYSERWFKPLLLGLGRWRLALPGWIRMVVPRYRRMMKRFVAWANGDPNAKVFAVGPWARRDFLMMGVKAEKIFPWGYFVAPSERCVSSVRRSRNHILKVLWVGRLGVRWKHVDDIQAAVEVANRHLVEESEDRQERVRLTILTGVPISDVRKAMYNHDLYVLASDGNEGWGAALNEALEEGMNAVGTFEAGASAAMLPQERLYHAGDAHALARLIYKEYHNLLPACSIGQWTAVEAAERLLM